MKTKRIIYFVMIVLGAFIAATGEIWIRKEFAMVLGMVLLMAGVYLSTRIWQPASKHSDTCHDEHF